MLKAKNKALNARNDEPEPDFLAVEIPITNVIENIKQTRVLYSKEFVSHMKAPPRPEEYGIGNRRNMRTPWKFSLSVFRDYKSDKQ